MHQCIKFNLFWNDTLRVSEGLSVHHQAFKTVHTATGICKNVNPEMGKITSESIYIYIYIYTHEGKSLNNRNFILKCMEKYAQRKILFRDTKWLLSNMSYRGRDDEVV